MSNYKLDPKKLEEAKKLYLVQDQDNFSAIQEVTGISRATIKKYVEKSWKLEKIASSSKAIEAFATMNANSIIEMTQDGMSLIQRSIKQLSEMGVPMPPNQIKALVEALQKLQELQEKINNQNKEEKKARDVESQIIDINDPFN